MTLQKDWVKTQIRLPPDLHPLIKQYAKDNDLPMNTAMIELLKKGLNLATVDKEGVKISFNNSPTQTIDISDALADIFAEIQTLKAMAEKKDE